MQGRPVRLGGTWVGLAAFAVALVVPTVMITLAARAAFAPDPPGGGAPTTSAAAPPPGSPGAGRADLVASLRTDPAEPRPGTPVTFVAGVSSRGPTTTGFSALVLTLPPGTQVRSAKAAGDVRCATAGTRLTCTGPGLEEGGRRELTVVAQVPDTAALGAAAATVAVSSDLADPVPGNDVATTASREQRSADLVVAAPAPVGPVVAGARVVLAPTVTNRGPSVAEGTTLTTVLPPGATYVSGTVPGGACAAVGGEVTCTVPRPVVIGETVAVAITAAIEPSFDAPALLVPTTAVGTTPDPRPADDLAVTNAPVTARAALDTTTQAPATVTAGSDTTHAVVVTNRGPSDARDVVLTTGGVGGAEPVDVEGGDCTGDGVTRRCALGVLPAGASARVRVISTVPPDAVAGPGPLDVRVTSTTPRGPATAPPAPPTPPTVTTVGRLADLSVAIGSERRGGLTGATGTGAAYTMTARNLGPSVSSAAVLRATVPNGLTVGAVSPGCTVVTQQVTCPVGPLPVGATASATVATGVAPGLLLTPEPVQARVATLPAADPAAASTDPQPTDDTAVAAAGDRAGADLAITATTAPGPVVAGTRTVRTLTVVNRGPAAAAAVVATDAPGTGLTPVDVPPGCTLAPATVSCPLGDLPAGAVRVVRIPVDVAPTAATGPVTGTATVRPAALVDPSDSNATSTTLSPVTATADLTTVLDRVEPGPLTAGGPPATYRVRTTNTGPSTATAAAVELDALPRGLTVLGASAGPVGGTTGQAVAVTATPGGAACTVGPSRAVCPVGDLPPGSAVEVRVAVAVAEDVTRPGAPRGPEDPSAVTASATSMVVDPTPADATARLADPVVGTADLRTRIDVDPTTTPYGLVAGGSRLALRVALTNAGPARAVATALTTTLPRGTRVVSALPTRGRCTTAAGTGVAGPRIDCTPGDLGTGGTALALVVVDVPADTTGPLEVRAAAASPTPDPTPADRLAVLALPVGAPGTLPGAIAVGVPPGSPGAGPVALLGRLAALSGPGAIGLAGVIAFVAAAGLVSAMRSRRREPHASDAVTERIDLRD